MSKVSPCFEQHHIHVSTNKSPKCNAIIKQGITVLSVHNERLFDDPLIFATKVRRTLRN